MIRAQEIAFTWDDLPAHGPLPKNTTRVEIADQIIAASKAAGMPPAYGFINGIRTVQEPASAVVLDHWLAAGFPLGNHTWSHMNLNDHTAAEWEADAEKNEPLLREKAGATDWHWLRYPNLAEGNTPEKLAEVRQYLSAHGYRVAGVTMSFADWAFSGPYARCVAKNDEAGIRKLEELYMDSAERTLRHTRALAKAAYGHEIPYVLLMHIGALDARMLPRLLAMYKAQGMKFITLEQAQASPHYRNDMDLSGSTQMPSLDTVAKQHGAAVPKGPGLPDFSTICQ